MFGISEDQKNMEHLDVSKSIFVLCARELFEHSDHRVRLKSAQLCIYIKVRWACIAWVSRPCTRQVERDLSLL